MKAWTEWTKRCNIKLRKEEEKRRKRVAARRGIYTSGLRGQCAVDSTIEKGIKVDVAPLILLKREKGVK